MASVRKKRASNRRSVSNLSLSQPSPNALSITSVQTRKSVARHLFSSSWGSFSSFNEYSHSDSFDVLPKTDYTYARTGSYSPRHLRKAYVNPNMSRHKLHGGVTPPVIMLEDSDSDRDIDNSLLMDTDIGVGHNLKAASSISIIDSPSYHHSRLRSEDRDISFDEAEAEEMNWNSRLEAKHVSDHENRLFQSSENAKDQNSVDFEGMILRSGSHLKGITHFLSRSAGNRRNSTSTLSSTTINTLITTEETRGSSSAINVCEQQQRNEHLLTGRPRSKFISNVDFDADLNNSARTRTQNTRSPEKKQQDRSYYSRDDYEHERKRVADERQSEKQEHRIHHMFGLDEEEVSEYSDSDSYGSPICHAYRRAASPRRWTNFLGLGTVIHFLFGGGALARIRRMRRNASLSHGSGWMWKTFESMSFSCVALDAWIQSMRPGKRWCLCLPVLLLLVPALLFPLTPTYISEIWSLKQYLAPCYFAEYGAQLVCKDEVQRIVMALNSQHGHWTTREDVEMILREMLQPEMETIRLSLLNVANEGNQMQDNVKINLQDTKTRLGVVEQHLAALQAKTKILEEEPKKTAFSLERSIAGERERNTRVSSHLETALHKAQMEIRGLKAQYTGLSAYDRKCCINDTMLVAAIRSEVNSMISGMFGQPMGGDSLAQWLNQHYVNRHDFDRQLQYLKADITQRLSSSLESRRRNIVMPPGSKGLSEDAVKLIVEDALLKYSADRTGQPDYALESAGGSVISTRCSQTYYKKNGLISMLGIPLWYVSNSPRTVIQPDVHAGQCWAFKGHSGYLVIQLSMPIRPTGFSLEHIPKSLSPAGNIDSAPHNFAVYGLVTDTDMQGVDLGNFTYSTLGKPIQYFQVKIPDPGVFEFVELRVLSNHGNKDYTCLYRFRVHGVPA